MVNDKIEEQDGKGNVIEGSTDEKQAQRKMLKLTTGEWMIGNCYPVGDNSIMRVDKPFVVQVMPQGPGRVTFALFPSPTDILWLDLVAVIGECEIPQGIIQNYIQSTTGLQVAANQQGVAPRPGPVRQ